MDRKIDVRAAEVLLDAITDWATGDPLHDGLGYGPSYVAGLRRRFEERMAALSRGETGGGDGFESKVAAANRPPSHI